MSDDTLKLQVQTLPDSPGVYQYYDKNEVLLYVGKARNLKKRVASYFYKQQHSGKTQLLVKKIVAVKHIVVPTETDALLLENNLIKKHQPRYNVLLKDDKSYPWICIKNEPFPRIFSTRNYIKDGSEYFGPYTNIKTVRTLLDLIRGLFPLRTCYYDLSAAKISKSKYKKCLEFHLGNCQAPCEGLQNANSYELQIKAIRQILKGNFKDSLKQFRLQMLHLANDMLFEEAQKIKEKIEVLENYQAKSTIVNPKINNIDVFSLISDTQYAWVNFLQLSHGAIIRSHTMEVKKKLEETDTHLLQLAIVEIRQRFNLLSDHLILPFKVDLGTAVKITVPSKGDKKKLLDLSQRNARFYRNERFKQIKITDPDRHSQRIVAQMQKDLRLKELPIHIECFDNSNLQGSNPVAACVVFKNAKPSKKDYRRFNIKTVKGANDFASMEEVVLRRYKRLLQEDSDLPQLIVIDGGKGQLSSAVKSLETLGLRNKIAVIGIAKRLEEIYFPNDPIPVYIDKRSETLKLIQQLRNEAHRFGISFHRNKRSQEAVKSELEQIDGIGEKTIMTLLRYFKSVKRIKKASFNELSAQIGASKAQKIMEVFKSQTVKSE